MVRALHWTALGASVRGASHERNGLPNQDAVRLRNPGGVDDFLVMAVADGHGSARSFRSDRGSAMATEIALRVLRQFIRHLGPDAPLSQVRRQAQRVWPRVMIAAWKSAVRADVAKRPFTFMDFAAYPDKPPVIKPGEELPGAAFLAYGATLVAVAITPRYVLYSQLGDGDILAIHEDGTVSRPLPKQHEFMSSQTVSLCTHSAPYQFQIKVEASRGHAPEMVMISTDGYANCFNTEEAFFTVGADLLAYSRSHGMATVGECLEGWLQESSRDGSGDDITVGLATRSRMGAVPHVAESAPVETTAEEPVGAESVA
jgi:hypothetical protein